MSILISLALVVLCFSYRTCNGRSFGVVATEGTAEEFQNPVGKRNEALNPTKVFVQLDTKSLTPIAHKGAKEDSIYEGNIKVPDPTVAKGMAVSGTRQAEELVTWKVPHKKRDEQEPGFNLDYLPPKTHPPVHN